MMKSNARKIENLISPVLFAVFALCTLFVLLTGAKAYRAVTQRDNAAFDGRTAAQYISTRVHQGDERGMLSAGELDGCSALIAQNLCIYVFEENQWTRFWEIFQETGWYRF